MSKANYDKRKAPIGQHIFQVEHYDNDKGYIQKQRCDRHVLSDASHAGEVYLVSEDDQRLFRVSRDNGRQTTTVATEITHEETKKNLLSLIYSEMQSRILSQEPGAIL